MIHLQSISKNIFLKADFEVLEKRINNFTTRGIAKAENQTFKELFIERQILYKKYADIAIDCNVLIQDLAAEKIIKTLNAI
jgi:shikimate kinase